MTTTHAARPATSRDRAPVVPDKKRGRHLPSAWHLVLFPLAVVMALPLVWMLVTSLSTREETRRFPPGLPSGLHFDGYERAWSSAPFGHWLLNSGIVSISCVIGNLLFCSLAGYAFARISFPGRRVVFFLLLATLMLPFQIVMIPVLIIVRDLGLVDSLPALIAPNFVTPFGIYLLRQFFLTLPRELEEAATIDGAGRLRVLFSILLPLMGAPLSTLAVLTFLWTWNDFLWPLIVTSSPDVMTVQVGLASFQGQHFTDWPALMAGTLMSQLPLLVLFMLGQRYFVRSLATTGLR